MATTNGSTDGSTRTGEHVPAGDGRACRERRTAPGSGRRLGAAAAGFAGLALGVGALTACTSASTAPPAGNGTVTVTSTTTPPSNPPGDSPSSTGASTTPGGPASPTSTSGGAEAPATQTAGGLARCAPGQMRVTVMGVPGGGSAGHQEMQIIATNTGKTQCTLQGYPGVSLTAPGSGTQLGASADRVPGDAPLIRLEPGKTAVSSLLVAQAAVYGSSCGETAAAGFRIYLPGQTAASFAPFPTSACRTASVHQLNVKPFTT